MVFPRPGRVHVIICINQGGYWKFAVGESLRAGGAAVKRREAVPMLADRVEALDARDDVRFLSVSVDRLRRWYRPGLLCIGDAAHATSPARGVGINLAVQDAGATANMAGGSLAPNSRCYWVTWR